MINNEKIIPIHFDKSSGSPIYNFVKDDVIQYIRSHEINITDEDMYKSINSIINEDRLWYDYYTTLNEIFIEYFKQEID